MFLFRSWRKAQTRVEWESKTGWLLTKEAELHLVPVKGRARLLLRDTHRSEEVERQEMVLVEGS